MTAVYWNGTPRSYVYRFIAVSKESAASILSVEIFFKLFLLTVVTLLSGRLLAVYQIKQGQFL